MIGPGMAISYHQLGNTAQLRGRLDEADEWYRRSLAIEEELGNRPGMALSYAQLGLLAEQQGQASSSLEWAIRCVILFDPFPHPATRPGALHLVRLTLQLGMPALEEAWRQVTGNPVPQPVRDYVTSHHNEDYGSEP